MKGDFNHRWNTVSDPSRGSLRLRGFILEVVLMGPLNLAPTPALT